MPRASVQARVAAAPGAVYDALLGTDPARLVRGYGPLPRVTATSDPDGTWGEAGASRTVHFGDGSAARERLDVAERPGRVVYRVFGYTNGLRFLARAAVADWRFEPEAGATRVAWTYTFEPRFALARLALAPVVHGSVRAYMRRVLGELARHAERAPGGGRKAPAAGGSPGGGAR